MKNLPTINELISFLKDNLKIILLTIISFLFIFTLGTGYTIYTNNKLEGTGEDTELIKDIDETVPLEEQLEPAEIELILEQLQENAVSFSFYLEKNPAEPFQSANLLKEILISPDVLQNIEEKTGITIEPSTELAVNVNVDPKKLLLSVTIGTGDLETNKILAEAYYTMISEENNSFFDNKSVYIVSEPEVITDKINKETISTETTDSNLNDFSYKRLIVLTIIVIIGGSIFGVILALILSLLKSTVSEIYGFAIKDDDTILNISNLKKNSKEELTKQIVHSIVHPAKKIKLILTEEKLDEDIVALLKNESDVYVEKNTPLVYENDSAVFIAKNITDISPKTVIDEIVFICKKDKTSKKWYEKQRKLLEVYKTKIKVILV